MAKNQEEKKVNEFKSPNEIYYTGAIMVGQEKDLKKKVVKSAKEAEVTEYDGKMADYKITGKAEFTDEDGNVKGELEIGSVQNLPVEIGDVFVEQKVAEKVVSKPKK